jgi:hypothetical protein
MYSTLRILYLDTRPRGYKKALRAWRFSIDTIAVFVSQASVLKYFGAQASKKAEVLAWIK